MNEHVTAHADHSHGHHEHHHHGAHPPAFSDSEMAEFHKSDIGAGGAVVVLMTAIFSIGLVLYGVIAYIVSR